MNTKLYLMLSFLFIGTVACQRSEEESSFPEDHSREMQFILHYPTAARVNGNGFETGDAIGLYVTTYEDGTPAPLLLAGNHTNNESLEYDGSAWQPRRPIYQSEQEMDVYAYYPYGKPASVEEYRFSVATDQNLPATADQPDSYGASDFLWGKAERVAPGTNPVEILFKHRMSKLNVILAKGENYEGELPENATIRIHNTVPVALIDLATGMPAKDPQGKTASITCKKLARDQFSAIIVPQRIATVRPFVELITEGVSYLVESTFTFKPGIEYTLTLTLNTQPDKILIDIGGQIDNTWN